MQKSTVEKIIMINICTFLFLTGCAPSKIQKEIDKVEKDNQEVSVEYSDKKNQDDEGDLSEEQLEILQDLNYSADEILNEKGFDTRKEFKLKKPVHKLKYDDPNELAAQINYLFYMYHTSQIDGENFYKSLSPYFHQNFIDYLPESEHDKIETFTILQKEFIKQLPASIVNVKMTNIDRSRLYDELNFYRKYELDNGDEIYFITILKKVDGYYYLMDDKPTPPYTLLPNIISELEEENQ